MFASNGLMDPEGYWIELEDIVYQSGSEILSYPILECGRKYLGHIVNNFIIVCVDYKYDPVLIGATQFGLGTWIKILDNNVNDCQVPGCSSNPIGVVVARFSSFPKTNNIKLESINLLQETFHSQGLKRCHTSHKGRFYMCGV